MEVVDYLLEMNADYSVVDDLGRTALHHAALHGQRDIAVTLIASGAPVNVIDAHGSTPLILAAANDSSAK